MAATADPRAKQPAAHHLEPWGRQQQPPRVHRVPAHPAVEESGPSADRDRRRSSSHSHRRSTGGGGEEPCDGGIEDLRAKLMGHLRDAADRLRVVPHQPTPPAPPPKAHPPEPEPEIILAPPPPAQQEQQEAEDKPWKLRERTRRRPAALTSWPAAPSRRRTKRAPFSVALAPEEVEDDIYALTGGRPRRRPRKRPRAVQRQLDSLFPGLWLTEITADDYKVPDAEE